MVTLAKNPRVSLTKSATPSNRFKSADRPGTWNVREGVAHNDMNALSSAFKNGVVI